MTYHHFDVQPLTSALGAEVSGLDLSQPLPAPVVDELKKAWLDHLVLFFRDQTLELAQFKAFAACFGELENLPFLDKKKDDPEVQVMNFGENPDAPPTNILHIDSSSRPTPSKGAMLYALNVPRAGGDTIWVNAYGAYDGLSTPVKELVDNLTAYFPSMDVKMRDRLVTQGPEGFEWVARFAKQMPLARPLVHTHPETGKKALFVDPLRMWRIPELAPDESRALIDFFAVHITKPELQCRFHWRSGSLAMWDNQCTLHRVVDDGYQPPRSMYRVSLKGTAWPEQKTPGSRTQRQ